MALALAYACTLFLAVLISCRARETVLSVSVLFLLVGLGLGDRRLGFPVPHQDFLFRLAEISLFTVLFTSGMKTGGLRAITKSWRLAGRALLLGMPFTIAGIAVIAHWLLGFGWAGCILLGAALSPTDPIFVSGIFQVQAVPQRVKHALNVESGLNDGLALPPLVITLAVVAGQQQHAVVSVLWELAIGLLAGAVIPWVGIRLERTRFFGAVGVFQRLNAFAIGLLVLTISEVIHANIFFSGFSAGIATATVSAEVTKAFYEFGEVITELLKLAVLLVFGARVAPIILSAFSVQTYVFAILAVLIVRPLVMWLALWRSGLSRRETFIIGIFGPKGFASVVYALIILHSGSRNASNIAAVVALAVTISIVFFSSTDILFGRWFTRTANKPRPEQHDRPDAA